MPEASGVDQVNRDVHQTKATWQRLIELPKDSDTCHRLPLHIDLYFSAGSGPPKCTLGQKLADTKVLALWPSASSQDTLLGSGILGCPRAHWKDKALMDVGDQQEGGSVFCGCGLDVNSSHRLSVLNTRSVSCLSCFRGD